MKICTIIFIILFSIYSPLFAIQHQDDLRDEITQSAKNINGMVSSITKQATQAGIDILNQGGNAVDAAVATAFALGVSAPAVANIGGGGFMLIYLKKQKKAIVIDYRERAPLKASADMFLDKNGAVDPNKIKFSYLASGVPGVVSGLTQAQAQYGRLPLKTVMAPAIKLAKSGFQLNFPLATRLKKYRDRMSEDAQSIFYPSPNQFYQPGALLKQTDLAKTLTTISKKGAKGFYQGQVAKRIARNSAKHHGLITRKDLARYQAKTVSPLKGSYRGYQVFTPSLPSSGGITLIEMLNMLENYPIAQLGLNNAKAIHLLTEVMNLAYKDRNSELGDTEQVKVSLKKLASKAYAKALTKKIDLNKHAPSSIINPQKNTLHEGTQTTHFSVVDQAGNLVANTMSLNYYFGSGKMIPGTGIFLNNQMDDFTAKPGMPNGFGLIQGKKNAIAPGKRPLSSMTPVILLTPEGQPFLATGSPGGSRITTTVLQVILNVIDHHLNIRTAISVPRIHSQLWPDVLEVESIGISSDTIKLLEEMGHTIKKMGAIGAANSVMVHPKFHSGATDPRRASVNVGIQIHPTTNQ